MFDLHAAQLFLLDMDGTFYLGDELLPGAAEFLDFCRETGRKFTFLTNNSSRSKTDYLEKLARLGISVTEREMYTSGDATLAYLAQHGFSRELLLIGTPSLEAQFAAAGYETAAKAPAAVVLGFDTTITYEKLTRLCDAVRAGQVLIRGEERGADGATVPVAARGAVIARCWLTHTVEMSMLEIRSEETGREAAVQQIVTPWFSLPAEPETY